MGLINLCIFLLILNNVQMKITKAKTIRQCLAFAGVAITIALSSCQKEMLSQSIYTPEIRKATIELPTITNPFSLRNV